ncbi:MAG: hypothetical protein ACE37I_07840 [Rubinisphaera brasiliensis]|uniref:hypothetical protein n=1 Tax=Rubinisphaera brasiliensis TaxID=119 RepID=UPI00391AC547
MIDLWDVAGALLWVLILMLPFLILGSGAGEGFIMVIGLFFAAVVFSRRGEQ